MDLVAGVKMVSIYKHVSMLMLTFGPKHWLQPHRAPLRPITMGTIQVIRCNLLHCDICLSIPQGFIQNFFFKDIYRIACMSAQRLAQASYERALRWDSGLVPVCSHSVFKRFLSDRRHKWTEINKGTVGEIIIVRGFSKCPGQTSFYGLIWSEWIDLQLQTGSFTLSPSLYKHV